MLKKYLLFLFVLYFSLNFPLYSLTNNNTINITKENRPWTRWWWPGSAVDSANIKFNLEALKQAGFGGVEITPIYGVKGYEDKFVEYLSPKWMDLLAFTIAEADRLELGVDMATGTGWPFGGPQVTSDDAAKKIVLQIVSSDSLGILQKKQQEGFKLIAAVIIDKKGNKKSITDNLTRIKPSDGTKIVAFFETFTGQKVKRAAPGGEGFVMDHFSITALRHYLARFDSAFAQSGVSKPRAFFNDSFEVYGANWTDELIAEFKKRRGYDLFKHIDALAGYGDKDRVARVKSDYRETIADILLDNFTRPWSLWSHTNGSLSRNQAHGSPGNLVDLYAAVDIPETEIFGPSGFKIPDLRIDPDFPSQQRTPPDPLMMKFASSAANLTGKKLVSSESFTWLGEHFKVALSQCKPEVDQLFMGGINHIFFHGTTFSPAEEEWPGWLFYASTHFGPTNTFWRDIGGLTQYIANCQCVLQNSTPDNDILLYFPVYDFWYDHKGLLKYFTVHNLDEWLYESDFYQTAKLLSDKGYTFDYVSDRLLSELNVEGHSLIINNVNYKVIVIPKSRFIPLATLKKLIFLAQNGVSIVFYDSLPNDVPGFADLKKRRREQKKLVNQINKDWQGRFMITDSIEEALFECQVRPERLREKNLQFIRKNYLNNPVYFVANTSAEKIEEWIPFNIKASSVWISNPVQNCLGKGVLKPAENENTTLVYIQIKPGESFFLLFNLDMLQTLNYIKPDSPGYPLDGDWVVEFLEGGPVLPKPVTMKELESWTELEDPNALCFSGTALYRIHFNKPDAVADEWLLDLGRIAESARVKLNGKEMGVVWCFPFHISLGNDLKLKENLLEIEVTNLGANRIIELEKKGKDWKKFYDINIVNINYRKFNAADWEPVESGLIGPVQLVPMKYFDP